MSVQVGGLRCLCSTTKDGSRARARGVGDQVRAGVVGAIGGDGSETIVTSLSVAVGFPLYEA